MLPVKGLTGVAPEVNLRNPLHTSKEALKPGIHPVFETGKTSSEFQKPGINGYKKVVQKIKNILRVWVQEEDRQPIKMLFFKNIEEIR